MDLKKLFKGKDLSGMFEEASEADRQLKAAAEDHALPLEGENQSAKGDSWDQVWHKMLCHGWYRIMDQEHEGEFIYTKPGKLRSTGRKGVDYFICTADIQGHVLKHGAWEAPSEKSVWLMLLAAARTSAAPQLSENDKRAAREGFRQFVRVAARPIIVRHLMGLPRERADGVIKLLSDMRQAADMQSPEHGLERALTMTGGAMDDTSDRFWAQKRQQAKDNTFNPSKDVALVRYLSGKDIGSDNADVQAEERDDFVGRMIEELWVKPRGLQQKRMHPTRQQIMLREYQAAYVEHSELHGAAFGECDSASDGTVGTQSTVESHTTYRGNWSMVPGSVAEARRASSECSCLSDTGFGGEGCWCELQVWCVRIVPNYKGDIKEDCRSMEVSKERMSIDGLRRILTKAAFAIVIEALGQDALRTAVIPFHWHVTYLKKHFVLRMRAAAGTKTMLEGRDGLGRTHPIALDWIATAHLGTAQVPLPEEWVKDMMERVEKGDPRWKEITEGAKKRRRKGDDLVLRWSRPGVSLKLGQAAGEHSCYSDSAATALELWGRKHGRKELVACAHKIHAEGKEIASRAATHQTAQITELVSGVVGDWGYRFEILDKYDPLVDQVGTPVVVRLISSGAYPHCVAIFGRHILDPTEPKAILLSRENLDCICGGRGKYLGVAWARGFRLHVTEEELQAKRLGDEGIPAPVRCCNTATVFVHKCTCRGGSTLVVAAAGVLYNLGLLDVARKLRASALENKEEISFQPRMWLRASLTRLLAEIKSSKMGCYSLGKNWDPFEEKKISWDMVVAEVRGHRHLYVGFVRNKMMTPSHPQWLDITEENMNFIADGEYKGLQWAMAFGTR